MRLGADGRAPRGSATSSGRAAGRLSASAAAGHAASPIRPRSWRPRSCRSCTMRCGAIGLRGRGGWRERLGLAPAQRDRAAGALHLRRRRARQIHADGPVLRRGAGRRRSAACISTPSCWRCIDALHRWRQARRAGDPIPPLARAIAERGLAALLRRVPGHQHRRRHAARPAVRGAVRAGRGGGHDLELRARRSLQGRAAARALPALHRSDQGAARHPASSTAAWITGCWRVQDLDVYHTPLGAAGDRGAR